MSDEAWRQSIAKAELLLSEGEAAEDIAGIADAVSGFNAALKLATRNEAPLDWAKTQSRLSAALRALGASVATGRFRADMQVELVNDGPVTLLLEVPNR